MRSSKARRASSSAVSISARVIVTVRGWVAEAVGALVEAREPVTVDAIWETLATVPIEGFGELTRGYYLQWLDKNRDSGLVAMVRDAPREFIDDVLQVMRNAGQTEVTHGNRTDCE